MLCVFDFDGTLADSKVAYYETVRRYARSNGLSMLSKAEMDAVFGNPSPSIIERWGSVSDLKKHLEIIFLGVDDVLLSNPSCMPLFVGIKNLLIDLKKEKVSIAIATSRNINPIRCVLNHHRIESYFEIICSAQDMIDYGYRGKPHPDKLEAVLKNLNVSKSQAIMVGDTHMDIEMAKNAGVLAVGVLWGYHNKELLLKYGADAVVKSPTEIMELI